MIASQKPQNIGPAIPRHTRVLLGGDLSRSGSDYRAMSRSAWSADVDRRSQGHARPAGTATATQCKLVQSTASDSALQNQAKNQRNHCPLMTGTYPPPQPLTKNHNGVPSLSPGLAAQRPTPGKLPHKIQPLISRECGPREARIKTAANFPKIQNSTLKIQHYFPPPQTNPHPKSTHGQGLIKVKNGLRPPLSPTCYRPKSGPKIRGSNQNQTATHQKINSAFPLFLSTTNEEFQVKTRPFFRHPMLTYSTLCQPILPILTP